MVQVALLNSGMFQSLSDKCCSVILHQLLQSGGGVFVCHNIILPVLPDKPPKLETNWKTVKSSVRSEKSPHF